MENNLSEKIPKGNITFDSSKPINEQVKQFVDCLATEKALQDEALKQQITDKKEQELINNAEANLKKEQAENKKAEVEIQQAEFGAFEGVAKYAGISHHLPRKMQQIVFSILCIFQGIFLILFGIPVSIVKILIQQIDSIVTTLASVAKSVRRTVLSMFVISLIAILIFVIYKFVIR